MAEKETKQEKLSKKGITKGVIKSLRTLDLGQLYKNFRAKPGRTAVKTFLMQVKKFQL